MSKPGQSVSEFPAIALVGTVGQGKTTIWSRLCGRRARSKATIESGVGFCGAEINEAGRTFELIDTLGIEGLTGTAKDDLLVWDLLLDTRIGGIGLVMGARDLRRGLLLALQLSDFEKPLAIDLNRMDEARQAGIRIDGERLEEILGVQTAETIATEGKGVRSFGRLLAEAAASKSMVRYPEDVEGGIREISKRIPDASVPTRAIAVRLLEHPELLEGVVETRWGPEVARECGEVVRSVQSSFTRSLDVVMAEARIRRADAILEEIVSVSPPLRPPLAERLGVWSRHPVAGIPFALLVIAAMYLFVGRVGAQWLVGLVEGALFLDRLVPWVDGLLGPLPWPVVRDAVVGEFGLLSVGLTLAIGIVMPVLVTFFLAFNLLEDSGYLARLSILLDRGLRTIGLGGRGLFPLVMGFSCITMALLTTRVLETRKERVIASLLLILGLPCAPLLSVMLVVLAPMPWTAPLFVFGVLFGQILVVGFIATRLLPGKRSDFVITVPAMRIPKFGPILRKTLARSWWFIAEAVPFFLVATLGLFVLDRLGALDFLERLARPVVGRFLLLPDEAVQVFMMTLIRREAGAAKLAADAGAFTNLQIVITLLVMTFFSPCVNAILVMFKERGFRVGLAILGFVMPYAVVLGAGLHWILRGLGVTFR